MDIIGKRIWQVAAGDTNRNYADLCLKWDVILNGPGSAGKWPSCAKILSAEWKTSARKVTDLKRFCEEIKEGDIVVLRIGTTDVFGVGITVGGYEWSSEFGDVDGWDLHHVRRVRWLWKAPQDPRYPKRFDTYTMKLGDTVQSLDSQVVLDWITQLEISPSEFNRKLENLPPSNEDPHPGTVTIDEISDYLFDNGMASDSILSLVDEIGELIRIAKWYQRAIDPSESETIAYLTIPLLRALGWTPQKMAIEWKKVDIALFSHLPRYDENLAVVVEAKQKNSACLSSRSQAQDYAVKKGREGCRRLIVTDGLRYGVYVRQGLQFPSEPQAYLNLTRMRREYSIYGCGGTKEALLLMSPDWELGLTEKLKIQIKQTSPITDSDNVDQLI